MLEVGKCVSPNIVPVNDAMIHSLAIIKNVTQNILNVCSSSGKISIFSYNKGYPHVPTTVSTDSAGKVGLRDGT